MDHTKGYKKTKFGKLKIKDKFGLVLDVGDDSLLRIKTGKTSAQFANGCYMLFPENNLHSDMVVFIKKKKVK